MDHTPTTASGICSMDAWEISRLAAFAAPAYIPTVYCSVSINFLLQITDRKLTAWGLPGGRAKSNKPMWPADRIVFLNDVYFCARDTIRLLQHDGDMVCGLDFDRPKLEEMPGEVG